MLDKLHAEFGELHKLNYKFIQFDKLNNKTVSWMSWISCKLSRVSCIS